MFSVSGQQILQIFFSNLHSGKIAQTGPSTRRVYSWFYFETLSSSAKGGPLSASSSSSSSSFDQKLMPPLSTANAFAAARPSVPPPPPPPPLPSDRRAAQLDWDPPIIRNIKRNFFCLSHCKLSKKCRALMCFNSKFGDSRTFPPSERPL